MDVPTSSAQKPLHDIDSDEAYWQALLRDDRDSDAASAPRRTGATAAPARSAESDGTQDALETDWQQAAVLMQSDHVIELNVSGANRGGLLVRWQSLRGFVPASQLLEFDGTAEGLRRQHSLARYIGQVLRLRIIELNPQLNRLIFSERAAQVKPGERAGLLHSVSEGDRLFGYVTNVCAFGAFVDLGGVEGLIHISELSWGRVRHPSDVVKRGQQIQVVVLDVSPEAGRIALSMKRLLPNPWATVHDRFQTGQVIDVMITNVTEFGAFARVDEQLEGLIHVSELAEGHFLHPRNVVTEGQWVRARILHIDGEAKRFSLTLRGASSEP